MISYWKVFRIENIITSLDKYSLVFTIFLQMKEHLIYLTQRFSPRKDFYLLGIFGNVWRHCCQNQGLLLVSSGWGPGMFLNILQSTGQFPTTKNFPDHNTDSGEVEKPWCNLKHSFCIILKIKLKKKIQYLLISFFFHLLYLNDQMASELHFQIRSWIPTIVTLKPRLSQHSAAIFIPSADIFIPSTFH